MHIIDRANANPARRSAVPWWAAFGAPLMGVPLLVGLLTLASPQTAQEPPVPETGTTFTTDEVAEPAPEMAERMVDLHHERAPEPGEFQNG